MAGFVELPFNGRCAALEWCCRVVPEFGNELSGDFVVVESDRPDGGTLILVGDVSGNGAIPHPVVRLIVDQFLPESHLWGLRPAALLQTLHSMLAPVFAETGRFVAAMALLFPGNREAIHISNAGQPPVLVGAFGGAWTRCEPPPGPILGVAELVDHHRQVQFALPQTPRIIAMTDGVTDHDAGRPAGQRGLRLIEDLLESLKPNVTPIHALEAILAGLGAGTESPWPPSDTTVCVFAL